MKIGWKKQGKPAMATGILLALILLTVGVTQEDIREPIEQTYQEESLPGEGEDRDSEGIHEATDVEDNTIEEVTDTEDSIVGEAVDTEDNIVEEAADTASNLFEGYRLIHVDGGDQSGHREPNVVVDIGFGDREYWAFTNEYGQLVKVVADKITLQDEENEPVLSTGRYYSDEAKVPGVESKTLDEGHVIADSLGGVANAYNITPQNSTLNRHGDQAYMERAIREAGGCTDFVAIITYPNNHTQIPSHYSYTYTINGQTIHDSFDNINSDEANTSLNTGESNKETTVVTPTPSIANTGVKIAALDKVEEFIVIKNNHSEAMNLSGWKIVSVTGSQTFVFPEYSLQPGASVKVGDSERNTDIDLHWMKGNGIWNNNSSDPAELYNASGQLVDRLDN